jgi:threonine dehydratase
LITVGEEDVAEAMVLLLERSKLVVEGAGAVGVAALLGGRIPRAAAEGPTLVVLSGGNVDAGLLAQIANHHETHAGRRLRLFTRVPDRPGGLAGLVNAVATAGGNLRTLDHVRDAVDLPVRDTGVHVVLETRGPEHSQAIVVALRDAGYEVDAHGAA